MRRRSESLEQRIYLSTTSLFASGHLQILSDAEDSIVVGTNPAVPGMVQVTVNGMPEPSLASIQASTVQAITIIGSDTDNLIDLSGVTAADFTFVDPDTGLGVQIFVDGDDGHDTITGSLDLGGTLRGGNGADTIIGLDGDDSIDGGDGADSISAGAGNDTIDSGDGSDVIDAGTGNDVVDSGNGQDSVNGGDGDDTINSGDGSDTVDGGAGADSINGMSGEDSLIGG
ncbi:MAG: calcium-binding protein, partial [Planctomycetota bacterium]|nr:calcium-binding protein [Planctomycetota bacterium]